MAVTYLVLAYRQRDAARGWSSWRTASFLTGCTVLALALTRGSAGLHDFRGHMLQHLAVGMIAPLLLVLAAPVTLDRAPLSLDPWTGGLKVAGERAW